MGQVQESSGLACKGTVIICLELEKSFSSTFIITIISCYILYVINLLAKLKL